MNIDLNKGPIVLDNFLNQHDLEKLIFQLDTHRWQYGNTSYEGSQHKFWFQLHYNSDKNVKSAYNFIHTHITEYIKNKVNLNLKLCRAHANGQTYGQNGEFHIDNHNSFKKYMTCIIYLTPEVNEKNKFTYEGCTEFHINDMVLSVHPVFNRAVFFNSEIPHKGTCFNRFKSELRVSMAYVFEVL